MVNTLVIYYSHLLFNDKELNKKNPCIVFSFLVEKYDYLSLAICLLFYNSQQSPSRTLAFVNFSRIP